MKLIDDPSFISAEHDPTGLDSWVETCSFGVVHISVMCEVAGKMAVLPGNLQQCTEELSRMWLAGEGPFAHDKFVGPYKWQRLRGEAPFASAAAVSQWCIMSAPPMKFDAAKETPSIEERLDQIIGLLQMIAEKQGCAL